MRPGRRLRQCLVPTAVAAAPAPAPAAHSPGHSLLFAHLLPAVRPLLTPVHPHQQFGDSGGRRPPRPEQWVQIRGDLDPPAFGGPDPRGWHPPDPAPQHRAPPEQHPELQRAQEPFRLWQQRPLRTAVGGPQCLRRTPLPVLVPPPCSPLPHLVRCALPRLHVHVRTLAPQQSLPRRRTQRTRLMLRRPPAARRCPP